MSTGMDPNFDTSMPGYFGNMRRVFGYPPIEEYPQVEPRKRVNLPSRSDSIALRDVDAWSHPNTWVPYRGLYPSHGARGEIAIRNHLYWDWHVEVGFQPRRY